MADEGVLGNGVKVAFSLTSPVSWTKIGDLLNVKVPGLQYDQVEKTTHGSTFHRFMGGLAKVTDTELQILQQLDETDTAGQVQNQLYGLLAARTTVWFRIEEPANRARTKYKATEYQGVVVDFVPDDPITDKQSLNVKIAFDGDSFVRYPVAGASAIS